MLLVLKTLDAFSIHKSAANRFHQNLYWIFQSYLTWQINILDSRLKMECKVEKVKTFTKLTIKCIKIVSNISQTSHTLNIQLAQNKFNSNVTLKVHVSKMQQTFTKSGQSVLCILSKGSRTAEVGKERKTSLVG